MKLKVDFVRRYNPLPLTKAIGDEPTAGHLHPHHAAVNPPRGAVDFPGRLGQ